MRNKDGEFEAIGIQDRAIMAAMINAIKEQQSQIDTLTKAMNALIKKVEKLEE